MWNDIKQANFLWVGVAIIFGIVGYMSRAIRWKYLLEPLGYTASFKNRFWAVIFGYFANLAFPRIGEVARCGVLNKNENIPVDKLLGTVIAERVIDAFMLLLLTVITFFVKIELFGTFILEKILIPTKQSAASVNPLLLILGILIFAAIVFAFIKTRHKYSFAKKISDFFGGILQGLKSVAQMKERKKFIFHTFLIWFSYWAMSYVIVFTIPQTMHLDPADGLFLLIVGGIGMTVPVQGGLGAYHYIVSHALVIFGLDQKTDGILFATISHESQTITIILLGIISVFILLKNKKSHEPGL